MTRPFVSTLLSISAVALLAVACSDDPAGPAPPTTGSVSGTVNFIGTWPASGDIQVSVYANLSSPWVPMGPPDGFTAPIATTTSYDYKIDGLDFGAYTAVYVSWRDSTNPSNSRLLGMYWAFADSVGINGSNGLPRVQPTGVTLSSSAASRTGLDVKADLALTP